MTRIQVGAALVLAAAVATAAGFRAIRPVGAGDAPAASGVVGVHEWGTFTSLQDETGRSIGGINTDDEPVPAFVHEGYPQLLKTATELPGIVGGKGITSYCLRDVTMRLETPVVYFHLPPGQREARLSVNVAFRGGWLTQFYPDAAATMPGLSFGQKIGRLDASTVGTLAWPALTVGPAAAGPKTTDPVWVAPRQAEAHDIRVQRPDGSAEGERFLFYRGVGHVEAPLRVERHGTDLVVHSRLESGMFEGPLEVPSSWVADIREDGRLAYRDMGKLALAAGDGVVGRVSVNFQESEYSSGARVELRKAVKAGLQRDGMNADEAEALLATWERSYFKSPGLRVLFMVPRAWTDRVLPLTVSGAETDVRRAMVGRIELVSDRQRELLHRLAAGPVGGTEWTVEAGKRMGGVAREVAEQIRAGRAPVKALGVSVPADYQAYVTLGRFREALVWDEQGRRASPALEAFIEAYGLAAAQGE
jgi:hypothetical protein